MVFTLLGVKSQALTENEARSLPKERRAQIEQAKQELRTEIALALNATLVLADSPKVGHKRGR